MSDPGAGPHAASLAAVLETLRDLELRLRDREARMAREIGSAMAALDRLAGDLRLAQAEASAASVLRARHAEFEADLAVAAKVQRSLIPRSSQTDDVILEVRYRPMRGVGGDLALALPGGPGRMLVGVADVTGHGVAAALLATRVMSHVRRLVELTAGPGEILVGLNDFILAHFGETGLFLTCALARLDVRGRELRFAGAGHPPALRLTRATGAVERLASQVTLLGIEPVLAADEREAVRPFDRGDRLVLYTDGVTESRSRSGRFFGFDPLERVVQATAAASAGEVAEAILAQAAGFRGGDPEDDIVVIVAEAA